DPTLIAMNGGEDYELLFTIPAEQVEIAGNMPEISIIGQITNEPGVYTLMGRVAGSTRISAQGWESGF
ncbi:MAG: thiamine-phosphate kinase, partial [Salinivirgaceae bacterium]|nr:thiamine-phosphate kinase [Salinivirgaceae bacterium]